MTSPLDHFVELTGLKVELAKRCFAENNNSYELTLASFVQSVPLLGDECFDDKSKTLKTNTTTINGELEKIYGAVEQVMTLAEVREHIAWHALSKHNWVAPNAIKDLTGEPAPTAASEPARYRNPAASSSQSVAQPRQSTPPAQSAPLQPQQSQQQSQSPPPQPERPQQQQGGAASVALPAAPQQTGASATKAPAAKPSFGATTTKQSAAIPGNSAAQTSSPASASPQPPVDGDAAATATAPVVAAAAPTAAAETGPILKTPGEASANPAFGNQSQSAPFSQEAANGKGDHVADGAQPESGEGQGAEAPGSALSEVSPASSAAFTSRGRGRGGAVRPAAESSAHPPPEAPPAAVSATAETPRSTETQQSRIAQVEPPQAEAGTAPLPPAFGNATQTQPGSGGKPQQSAWGQSTWGQSTFGSGTPAAAPGQQPPKKSAFGAAGGAYNAPAPPPVQFKSAFATGPAVPTPAKSSQL